MENTDTQKAMDLVETTENTLRVTANMIATASLLFTVGVKPKEGLDEAVRAQLETFRMAIQALNALADVYGIQKDKRIKKLFSACRDGFENLDEFCAECFMASEFTDAIPLANRYAEVLAEKSKVPARAGAH